MSPGGVSRASDTCGYALSAKPPELNPNPIPALPSFARGGLDHLQGQPARGVKALGEAAEQIGMSKVEIIEKYRTAAWDGAFQNINLISVTLDKVRIRSE